MDTGASNGGMLLDALKGAVAGLAAAWVMDRVSWAMYDSHDPAASTPEERRRENEALVEGKFVPQALAAKASRAAGVELSEEQTWRAGQVVHYAMGALPGAAYGALRGRVPYVGAGRGLAYGLALSAVVDEGLVPAMGLASPPTRYPLRTHARGLVAHLVVGAITDTLIDVMDEVTGAGRRVGAEERGDGARRPDAREARPSRDPWDEALGASVAREGAAV